MNKLTLIFIFFSLNCYSQSGFEYSILELLGKEFIKINNITKLVDKYDVYSPIDEDTLYINLDSLTLSLSDKKILSKYSSDELKTIKLMKTIIGNKSLFKPDSFNCFYVLDTINFFGKPLVYQKNDFKLKVIKQKNEIDSNSLIRLVAYKIDDDKIVLAFDFLDFEIGFNIFIKIRNIGVPVWYLTYRMYYMSQHLLNIKKYNK